MMSSQNYRISKTSKLFNLVLFNDGHFLFMFSRFILFVGMMILLLFTCIELLFHFKFSSILDIFGVFFHFFGILAFGFLSRRALNDFYWLRGSEEVLRIDSVKRELLFYRKGFWHFDSIEIGLERIQAFGLRSTVDKKYGDDGPGDWGFGTGDGSLSLVYSNKNRNKIQILFGARSWIRLDFGTSLSNEDAEILAIWIRDEILSAGTNLAK